MLGSVHSEPDPLSDRQREIDARLVAIRGRLKKLRARDRDAVRSPGISASERLEAAQRHETQAAAAAVAALASAMQAFRTAARAHERVASVHERMAASGIGDVREQERQAARHRVAARTDWRRAERAQLLLSDVDWVRPAGGSGEAGGDVAL